MRWGFCAPRSSNGCVRTHAAGHVAAAGIGVSSTVAAAVPAKQMWVLVREQQEPWRRVQVVSRPERVEVFVDGMRTHSDARTVAGLPERNSFSSVGNSRDLWSGLGYLSRLALYPAAWSIEEIDAESRSRCRADDPSDTISQVSTESCTWTGPQATASASHGAFIVDEVLPHAVTVAAEITTGLFVLADPTAATRFQVGDSVHIAGTGWCETHAGRYKVQSVTEAELLLSLDHAGSEPWDTTTTCWVSRPAYISSGYVGGDGVVDFPSITPPVADGRGADVILPYKVRFSFSYHIRPPETSRADASVSSVLKLPSLVAALVAKSGQEHVFYTSHVLGGCIPKLGLTTCTNDVIDVDAQVPDFFSPSFHVRLRFISNDVSVELTGIDGAPVTVETMVCTGTRPASSPWAVARQENHWGSGSGDPPGERFLHTGSLSFFPGRDTIAASPQESCGDTDRNRVEYRANLQNGILTNGGYVEVLPPGTRPADGDTAVQVFNMDLTALLDEWIRMPYSNQGVRMVPRGVGMYRLECSLHVGYTPAIEMKAPLCRSSECAPGYTGERCASCITPKGSEKGFYRNSQNACHPCPSDFMWSVYLGVMGLVIFIILTVYIARKLRDVKDLGLKLAPMLIWVAFLQQVGMLLDFNIKWPDAVQTVLEIVSSFSFNLQVLRPECFESPEGDERICSISIQKQQTHTHTHTHTHIHTHTQENHALCL